MESWRVDLPALTMCLLGDYTLFECSSFTLDNTPALKTLLCFDFAVYSCQTFVAIGTVLVGAVDVKSLEKCILGMNCFFRLETIQKKSLVWGVLTSRHFGSTLHGTEQETEVPSQGCDYLIRALF